MKVETQGTVQTATSQFDKERQIEMVWTSGMYTDWLAQTLLEIKEIKQKLGSPRKWPTNVSVCFVIRPK